MVYGNLDVLVGVFLDYFNISNTELLKSHVTICSVIRSLIREYQVYSTLVRLLCIQRLAHRLLLRLYHHSLPYISAAQA